MIWLFVLLSLPLVSVSLIRFTIDSTTSHSHERAVILKQGSIFGLLMGTVFMGLSLFGNLIHLSTALESVIDLVVVPVFLGVTVLTFAISGYRTSRLTGHLWAASLAGLLTGIFAFMLLGLSFVILDMVFFDIVRQQPEKVFNFAHSSYSDMRAYLFDSTVRGATLVTLAGGVLGALFGSVGGLVGNRKHVQRRTS